MSNNFLRAIKFTLPWETGRDRKGNPREDGGYTNDPSDPGGETKWGISKKAHPELNIKELTIAEALNIYKKDYYDCYAARTPALNLDLCPPDYAVAVFDTGVNCGVNRTYSWHLTAIKTKDPTKTLLGLRDARYTDLVASNSKLQRFYKGWINRLNDLKKYCEILRADSSVLS